jgi:Gpi18-like mannosyltransferase
MTPQSKPFFLGITKEEVVKLVLLFIFWRIALFGIGAFADVFLRYAPSFPYADSLLTQYHLPRWLSSWANFDGVHYLTIAEKGYVGTGLIQAFFPMFPFVLLRTLFVVSGRQINLLLVGLFLTNAFTLASVITWFGFLKKSLKSTQAWFGTFLLLCFPLSLFFGALYTESLFFLAVIGSFWAAKNKNWWLTSFFMIVATATRIVGVFLFPALIVESWIQWRAEQSTKTLRTTHLHQLFNWVRDSWKSLLLVTLGMSGLFAYMLYLNHEFHDAFYFLHVQSEFGAGRQESFVIYPQVVWRSIKILFTMNPWSWRYYTSVLEFLSGVLGLLGILWAARFVRISYVIFALGAFFLPTLTGTFSSMPRYLLVCFPLYLLLIQVTRQRTKVKWGIITLFSVCLAINTVLFVQGYWLS